MYRILLTDDEQIAVDSLSITITKNFGAEVEIFTAYSGTRALEIVREKEIDIIFMDIQMPGLSGLETVSLVRQIRPDAVVIILSAYDEFQYAQKALNIGAFKYLTKPASRPLIVQTVRDAMNAVDEKRAASSDSETLRQKMSEVSAMVESDFIYSCVFNNKGTDFSEYRSYFEITGDEFFMACFEFPELKDGRRFEIYEALKKIVRQKFQCVIGSFMGNRIGAFFPVQSDGTDQNQTEREKKLRELFQTLAVRLGEKIKMGISRVENKIENAQAAYNEAAAAISKNPNLTCIEICAPQNGGAPKKINSSGDEFGNAKKSARKKILSAVRKGDKEAAAAACQEFCDAIFATENSANSESAKEAAFETLVAARDEAVKNSGADLSAVTEGTFGFFSRTSSRAEIERFFSERVLQCAQTPATSQRRNPLVRRARDYIALRLDQDLSLESVAAELGASPFYLSRIFKEETGETFVNYVYSARLEKAKELLQDTSLIIKEVTARVGYSDQNYFSKSFKQKFGITPSEFRLRFAQSEVNNEGNL